MALPCTHRAVGIVCVCESPLGFPNRYRCGLVSSRSNSCRVAQPISSSFLRLATSTFSCSALNPFGSLGGGHDVKEKSSNCTSGLRGRSIVPHVPTERLNTAVEVKEGGGREVEGGEGEGSCVLLMLRCYLDTAID